MSDKTTVEMVRIKNAGDWPVRAGVGDQVVIIPPGETEEVILPLIKKPIVGDVE